MTLASTLHLLVPGPITQRTGGYLYDARMVEGLRAMDWEVTVHSLEGSFPIPDEDGRESTALALSEVPDSARTVVDGLALPTLETLEGAAETKRRLLGLVHHLTSDETGLNHLQSKCLRNLETGILQRVSGVVVTSEFTATEVARLGVPPQRIECVVPGTERSDLAMGPGADEPPALLCVGALIPRKGQDVLVRALARLTALPWSCTLAGSPSRDPQFSGRLRAMAEEFGLSGRITFAGECTEPQLRELYSRSSAFVFPSHFEGFGMAIAEALAHGLPIVSTTGGAIPSTVSPQAGLLVPPGDEIALANAISTLLDRDSRESDVARSLSGAEVRSRLSRAARRRGMELPAWDQQVRAFAEAVVALAP